MQNLNKANNFYKTIFSLNLLGALITIEFVLLLSGFLLKISGIIMVILILLPIVIFWILAPKSPVYFLILTIIFTEFYWIEILGGYLKPFHVISALLLFFLISYFTILKSSKIVWLLVSFIIMNIISILFSENKLDSLRSFILPLILISIAINIAMALYTKRLDTINLRKIVLYGSLIVVGFAISQMIAYSSFGISLTFTDSQNASIVLAKRPPSFFTEADTLGKFLSFPFFLLLPFALEKGRKSNRYFKIGILILLIAIIINMTRSAMIGIGITLILYAMYSFIRKGLDRTVAILSGIMGLMLILLPFTFGITKVVGSHDELIYRLQTLLSPSQLIADGSTHFRITALEETFKGIFESTSAFLLGHGWGQSSIYVWGIPRDVGGNLLLSILYYSGIFALLLFIVICYRVLKILFNFAKNKSSKNRDLFAEGLFFSFFCMLIISQLASMWIAPEFWLVIGCAIYLELYHKRKLS